MSNTTPNLFLEASREKLRFQTAGGLIVVEDLWDLSLPSLDNIAVAVNARLKEAPDSFLKAADKKKTKARATDELRLEILKVIIETKQNEAEAARDAAAKREKLAQLRALREQKLLDQQGNLSVEQIDKEIEALS